VDLERYKKDAKALVRAHRAGDDEAIARAADVLGERARERFQLSDAQHVVAVEHGYNTWPELKRAIEVARPERPVARIGLQPLSFYEERAAALPNDVDAVRRVRAHVARLADYAGGPVDQRDTQLVVAREYGFQTWRELVATVERVRATHEDQRDGSPDVLAALECIRRGDVAALAALLDEEPELVGHVHNGAWSTLLEAIAEPDVVGDTYLGVELGVKPEIVALLVERGAELDTALNLAACFNRVELVRLLLDAGADPAPDPAGGLTHLETALYHGAREAADVLADRAISPYALWSVAALGRVDELPTFFDRAGNLLPHAGAHRPNLADVGWTPAAPPGDDTQTILDEALCHAAHNGRDDAVAWLLDHGADVDGRPYLDFTPLHFAVQFGHESTARLLVERGADLNIRERMHDGTPLDWAKHLGRDALVPLLDRTERSVETGLEYGPGDPVVLRVVQRRHLNVLDDGAAVERAGRPPGWRAVAERLADELVVNISRSGVVSLPVSRRGPGYDAIVRRIAHASLAFYQELLELAD
jgi:Ankyrin repeats (many copies)